MGTCGRGDLAPVVLLRAADCVIDEGLIGLHTKCFGRHLRCNAHEEGFGYVLWSMVGRLWVELRPKIPGTMYARTPRRSRRSRHLCTSRSSKRAADRLRSSSLFIMMQPTTEGQYVRGTVCQNFEKCPGRSIMAKILATTMHSCVHRHIKRERQENCRLENGSHTLYKIAS